MEGSHSQHSCFTAQPLFSGNDDNEDDVTNSVEDEEIIPIQQKEQQSKKQSFSLHPFFLHRQNRQYHYTKVLLFLSSILIGSALLCSTDLIKATYNQNKKKSFIGGIFKRHKKIKHDKFFLRRKGVTAATETAHHHFPQELNGDSRMNHLGNIDRIAFDEPLCTVKCCHSLLVDDTHDYAYQRFLEESNEKEEDNSWVQKVPFWLQMVLIVVLILLSALFSGLTLGLMGLDKTGLEIVMEGDDPEARRAARKIYPIRSNGNLLLCTLLLGNVAVNAMLSILMADISGGIIGFFVSTISIVIFGEIIPQAACSRYALQIGYRAVPLVRIIRFLFWPISAPIALALDKILGHELGTTYSKAEMNKLLEIHVKEGRFNQETGTAMAGALKYQDITVKEVMTPLEHTFMLDAEEKFSFETITKVFKTGFSRIPVYEISVNNIIGLLFVKDLIFIDPEDETPVKSFIQIFGRGAHVVWPDDKLGDVLRDLKGGKSHMALVRDVNNDSEKQDPFYEIKGIVTLEDIIEIILGDEIVDETDAWVDGNHSIRVDRNADFDWAKLRLLDSKIVDKTLSQEEVRAVSAHLRTNHGNAFEMLSEKQLLRMVALTPVTVLPASEVDIDNSLPEKFLYEKGKPCSFCTLILSGKITILAGSDNFRSDVSSWSVLAANALTDKSYAPDFNAYVTGEPCRCIMFTLQKFLAAMDVSAVEKNTPNNINMNARLSPSSNNFNSDKVNRKIESSPDSIDLGFDNKNNVDCDANHTSRELSTSLHHGEKSIPDTSSTPRDKEISSNTTSTKTQREAVQNHRSKLLHKFYINTSKDIKEQHLDKEDEFLNETNNVSSD